jgi:hypothetical protein
MQGLLELNPRVVVDEVEPSELRTREVNRRIDVGDLRDVDPQADSLAACRSNEIDRVIGATDINVDANDGGSRGGECQSALSAEALRCAGYDAKTTVKFHGDVSLSIGCRWM